MNEHSCPIVRRLFIGWCEYQDKCVLVETCADKEQKISVPMPYDSAGAVTVHCQADFLKFFAFTIQNIPHIPALIITLQQRKREGERRTKATQSDSITEYVSFAKHKPTSSHIHL